MYYNRKSVTVTSSTDARIWLASDLRRHLHAVPEDDDEILENYIDSATEKVKAYLGVALRTETFKFVMDGFSPGDADQRLRALGGGWHDVSKIHVMGHNSYFDLPYTPIASIDSITTYDRDNVGTVYSSANYTLDALSGRVFLNESSTWPTDLRDRAAVEVSYVAGYGAADVPADIKDAVRRVAERLYDKCSDPLSHSMKMELACHKISDGLVWQ